MARQHDRVDEPASPHRDEAGDQHTPGDRHVIDLGGFIRTQRETARMSVRRLAELAGVSNPYLSQIERGLRRPSAEILQQIARALQISAETLYVRAGFLSADAESAHPGDTRTVIAADPRLSPEQRDALIRVYDSFVAGAAEPGRRRSGERES